MSHPHEMTRTAAQSGLSKTYTIPLNADNNRAYTTNNLVKLSAIEIRSLASNLVHINGSSSRGKEIKNFGFELQADPHLLRELSTAMSNMANDITQHRAQAKQQEMESMEIELHNAGYSIENCAECKGQCYFYYGPDDYASTNFHSRQLALEAAYSDFQLTPENRIKERV